MSRLRAPLVMASMFAAATLMLTTPATWAQTYPSGPVRVLVPFAPGGATDILARVFADRLQQRLGQPFTVENRAGAAGQIAAAAFRYRTPGSRLLLPHFAARRGRWADGA